MKKLLVCLVAAMLGITTVSAAKPNVVAHRGYWKTEGSAQNSIRSLVKADSIGADFSEFDVWMCTDGVVVLNHDGVIEGDTVQKCTSAKICAHKLENGENVPTLDEFLNVAKDLKIGLVLEIKWHANAQREDSCVNACLALLKKYDLLNRTEFISFSKNVCKTIGNTVARPNMYLGSDLNPKQIKELGCTGADLSYKTFQKHPDYIPELKERAMGINVWTIDTEEKIQKSIDDGVGYITTNAPELAQQLVAKAYPEETACCKNKKCDKKCKKAKKSK